VRARAFFTPAQAGTQPPATEHKEAAEAKTEQMQQPKQAAAIMGGEE